MFKRNQYYKSVINRVVKSYLDNAQNSNTSASPTDTSTIYFKLPFLYISNFTQRKVLMLAKTYCKNLNIKLAFSSFKVKNLISVKDCVPRSIGETSRPLSTRVHEHLFTDKTQIFLNIKRVRVGMLVVRGFKVLDSANTYHSLKIKEALHRWETTNLNKHLQHYNVSLSF